MLVASLNYSKTPRSPFPVAANDIAAVAGALLSDPTLPIDTSRVTIAGFSAGGLLALSAVQLPPLRGKVHAAVAYYPAVDFSEYPAVKFARRIDKTHAKEMLYTVGGSLDWAYVNPGQDRRDKVLSPCYARPEDLPRYVCVIAAQYDMFGREARDLIFDLAGKTIGDGKGWEEGFEENGYKWVYAKRMRHGFTEVIGREVGLRDRKRQEYCQWLFGDIHRWLEVHIM